MTLRNIPFFEELGIDLKQPLIRSEQERKRNVAKLQEALLDPEKSEKFFGEGWLYEAVADCLEREINNSINLYK